MLTGAAMATPSKPKAPAHSTPADTAEAVDVFMLALAHPFKREIEAIRAAILGSAPEIAEGIKWNAPSYRTHEYFATTHLREKKGVSIILHLGAKVKDLPDGGVQVQDPAQLLKWLGKDRAMVVFADLQDFRAKQAAFEELIRRWIEHV